MKPLSADWMQYQSSCLKHSAYFIIY